MNDPHDPRRGPTETSDNHPAAGPDSASELTRRLKWVGRGWLGCLPVSAGLGAMILVVFAIPWTITGFDRAELEVPPFIRSMEAARGLWAAVIGITMILGVASILSPWPRMPIGVRIVIFTICALGLLAIAVAGVLGWWMMYVATWDQALQM